MGLSSIKGAFGFLSEFGHSFQNLNRILNGAFRLPIQILNGRLTATCSRRGGRQVDGAGAAPSAWPSFMTSRSKQTGATRGL